MTDQNLPTPDLWAKTVDIVKHRVNSRSLWETLEKTIGIVVEEDQMVVGLPAHLFNLAGHLSVSEHRNAIEQALSEVAQRRLRIRVIEGESLADWVNVKERDKRVQAMREATYARKDRQAAQAQNWEMLYEHVARAYGSVPMRQLPQSKARYLNEMLYVLSDALDELGDEVDETNERHLARVLERVATNAEVPATLVALELQRLRAWTKQQAG